jgi:hypothetical protein
MQGTPTERDTAARYAGRERPGFGPDVALSEVSYQFIDAAKFEVSPEDGSDQFGFFFHMTGQDAIDLRNFSFGTVHVTSSSTTTSTTLTVTDGADVAHIVLLGNYIGSVFTSSNDGFGGTSIVDPHVSAAQTISLAQTPKL